MGQMSGLAGSSASGIVTYSVRGCGGRGCRDALAAAAFQAVALWSGRGSGTEWRMRAKTEKAVDGDSRLLRRRETRWKRRRRGSGE